MCLNYNIPNKMLIKLDTSTTDRKQITVKQLKINQVERNIEKSHLNWCTWFVMYIKLQNHSQK